MKELIHERLREWVSSSVTPIASASKDLGVLGYIGYEREAVVLKELADEIERQYIPRPRYEDGEPIQFGDAYQADNGTTQTLQQLHCFANGGYVLNRKGKRASVKPGEFVKRSHDVLDADGVRICKGDTVWSTDPTTLESAKVTRVNTNSVDVLWSDGERGECINPLHLTHREPDSLEKLRDAVISYLDGYGCSREAKEFGDRFTALIEREK